MASRSPARWALVATVALAAGGALLGGQIAATGRAHAPVVLRVAALAAFQQAGRGPAARWARPQLEAAEQALRDALVRYSREENRLFLLRDFRPAAVALLDARAAAVEAERVGDVHRDDALVSATDALQRARELEGHALALVAVTTLPAAQRRHLLQARLLVTEAQALLDGGDELAMAEARARAAWDELRLALGPALAQAERYTAREQVATWKRWVEQTRRHSRLTGATAIVVLKEKNLLVLLSGGEPVRQYPAEVGANALGSKRQRGDRATPEGRYRVVEKKDVGRSAYRRALLLDYPNADDRERFAAAKRRGEIPRGASIGGLIEIHGGGGRGQNWTDGCISLTNADIDDLYRRVPAGTPVTIVGGDGSDGAFSSLLEHVRAPGEGS